MTEKRVQHRDRKGRFVKGIIPSNKIILSKHKLELLYKKYGSKKIVEHLGVSKQTIIRNLREYGIPIRKSGVPSKLPDYWKKSLRVPKSKSNWNKGLTKETNSSMRKISEALKGERNYQWKPEIHTDETIECNCGCGCFILKYDKRGRRRYYLKNHAKGGRFKKNNIPWNKRKRRSSEVVHRILTRRTPNNEEQFLIKFFKYHNLPYSFVGDGSIIIDGRNPDFINSNGQKKIIEFFGEYWHKPEDEPEKREIYNRYGFDLLVIWGEELKNEDLLLTKVLDFNETKGGEIENAEKRIWT